VRLLLAALGLAVLVAAPAARSDDPAPRLVVLGRVGHVPSQIVLRDVAATSSVRILIPAGYTLTLGQAPGGPRGPASATTTTGEVLGGMVVVAPDGAAACDGAPHTAIWTLPLANATQVVTTVTIAADSSPSSLLVCTGGTNIARLVLQLSPVTLAPPTAPSHPVWEALISYPDGSQAASVSTLAIPTAVTLKGSYQRTKHQIAVSGRVLEGGAPAPAGRRVVVSIGNGPTTLTTLGATRTRANGTWLGVVTNVRKTLYVQAQVVVPEQDTTATACTPPTLTAPCVSATVAGYTATSSTVKIVVPALRR
jgi:hypothetical protein